MRIPDSLAKTILLDNSVVNEDQLAELEALAVDRHRALQDLIIENGLLSERDLARLYAEVVDLPFTDLKPSGIKRQDLSLLPERVARKYLAIVFKVEDPGSIKFVAMADPVDNASVGFLKKHLGDDLKIYVTTLSDIHDALDEYRGHISSELSHVIWQDVPKQPSGQLSETAVDQTVQLIIEKAAIAKASDIHIEPHENFVVVRYRVDGLLREVNKLPISLGEPLINSIKSLGGLRSSSGQAGTFGRAKVEVKGEVYGLRITSLPVIDGEKIVIHLSSETAKAPSLESLGFWGVGLKDIKRTMLEPHGLILVAGPNGSGKSTLLFSLLSDLNAHSHNISTIEDPVEYSLPGINQVAVGTNPRVSFYSGLKSILEQDPNIIMLSSLDDKKTADLAVQTALNKYLLLAGFNARDGLAGLKQLVDMGVESHLLAAAFRLVVSGRLVRRLCLNCRESFVPARAKLPIVERVFGLADYGGLRGLNALETEAAEAGLGRDVGVHDLNTTPSSIKHLYKARDGGCDSCNFSGYKGRIGLYEVVNKSDAITQAIAAGATIDKLTAAASKEGMLGFKVDGLIKALRGYTSVEEVLTSL
jgi:type IV pilus assembly protein PilB